MELSFGEGIKQLKKKINGTYCLLHLKADGFFTAKKMLDISSENAYNKCEHLNSWRAIMFLFLKHCSQIEWAYPGGMV